MPEVIVYCAEGRTHEQKKGLCLDITAAVHKNFGVDPQHITVTIQEAPKTHKMKNGVLFSER
jgi:4-oxalocrotonate tautomerase